MSIDGDSMRFQRELAQRIAKAFEDHHPTSANPSQLFEAAALFINAERDLAEAWLNGASITQTNNLFRLLDAAERMFETEMAEQFPHTVEDA